MLKYIVFKDSSGFEHFLIFSRALNHVDMGHNKNTISAGFVTFTMRGANCYGASTSLDLKARKQEDSQLINRELKSYL